MIKFTVVDAFTRTPFQGNQAAVCIPAHPMSDSAMQTMARELNLSETVFLEPVDHGAARYNIRWFTPVCEVDLCGHATLAAAHVLWTEGLHGHGVPLHFVTKTHGMLTVTKREDYICMQFPEFAITEYKNVPEALKSICGNMVFAGVASDTVIVELESGKLVENFQPDFAAIAKLSERGLIITAKSHRPQVDFVNRCFFPRVGINEDPVTGSAYCTLAPYWFAKFGKAALMGEQLSQRTGRVHVERDKGNLIISGQAVTTYKGIFTTKPF